MRGNNSGYSMAGYIRRAIWALLRAQIFTLVIMLILMFIYLESRLDNQHRQEILAYAWEQCGEPAIFGGCLEAPRIRLTMVNDAWKAGVRPNIRKVALAWAIICLMTIFRGWLEFLVSERKKASDLAG